MQVIGAGLPRTGTLTQKLAFEQLGLGPCYHWVDVLADLDRVEQWERALDGEPAWDEIFGDCQSSADWPGGFFYAQLSEIYPQAKVVLSVRDPARWEASFRETIWNMCFGDNLIQHLSAARATIDPRWKRYLQLVDRMFWIERGTFAAGHDRPEQLIAAMERHHEEVRRAWPRSACWSGTSTRGGSRCARSSSSRYPTNRSPTPTTATRSSAA